MRCKLITGLLSIAILCIADTEASAGGSGGGRMSTKGQPDIILLITDDTHKDIMYDAGALASTPNMSTFQSEGAFLATVFTDPICGASRVNLHKLQHSHLHGHSGFLAGGVRGPTYIKMLQDSGYATAVFGKGGMGKATAAADLTWAEFGADYYEGILGASIGDNYDYTWVSMTAANGALLSSTSETVNASNLKYGKSYVGDVITEAALAWYAAQRLAFPNQPIYMEVSYNAPVHVIVTEVPGQGCVTSLECFIEMVEYFDEFSLGPLHDAIGEDGVTWFLMSDNGPAVTTGVDTRGCKGSTLECGISVSLMAWGEHIEATGEVTAIHQMNDLGRTFADLSGSAILPGAEPGCSLMDDMSPSGGWTACTNTYVYASNVNDLIIRRQDGYKLVRPASGSTFELYLITGTPFNDDEGSNLCTGNCPGGLSGADLAAHDILKSTGVAHWGF